MAGQAEDRDKASENNQDNTRKLIEFCLESTFENRAVERLQCLIETVESEAESATAYYDLKAQQDMAAWALGVLFVSIASLFATVIGVIIVWTTFNATREANEIANRQLELATPPELRVNKVSIWSDEDGSQAPKLTPGKKIMGCAWVYNAGRDTARIRKNQLMVYWSAKTLPMISPLGRGHAFSISKKTLANGEADKWCFDTVVPADYEDGKMFLHVIGEVIYRSTPGIRRHVAFGRRYDPSEGYFVKSENPDYEIEI